MGLFDFLFDEKKKKRRADNPVLDRVPSVIDYSSAEPGLGARMMAAGAALQGNPGASAGILERARQAAADRRDLQREHDFAIKILTKRPDLIDVYMADPAGFGKYYRERTDTLTDAERKHKWDVEQATSQQQAEDARNAARIKADMDRQLQQQGFTTGQTQAGWQHTADVEAAKPENIFRQAQIDQLGQYGREVYKGGPDVLGPLQAPGMPGMQRGADPRALGPDVYAARHLTNMPDLTGPEAQQVLSGVYGGKYDETVDRVEKARQASTFGQGDFEVNGPGGLHIAYHGGKSGTGDGQQQQTADERRNTGLMVAGMPGLQQAVKDWRALSENQNSWLNWGAPPGSFTEPLRYYMSDAGQQASTGLESFISNHMYTMSGAAQSPDEITRLHGIVVPRPWDHAGESGFRRDILLGMAKGQYLIGAYPQLQQEVAREVQDRYNATKQEVPTEEVNRIIERVRQRLGIPDIDLLGALKEQDQSQAQPGQPSQPTPQPPAGNVQYNWSHDGGLQPQ